MSAMTLTAAQRRTSRKVRVVPEPEGRTIIPGAPPGAGRWRIFRHPPAAGAEPDRAGLIFERLDRLDTPAQPLVVPPPADPSGHGSPPICAAPRYSPAGFAGLPPRAPRPDHFYLPGSGPGRRRLAYCT